ARWAAGEVDVHRHHVVHALHDGVVVEHAAGGGAHAHRDDPLRVGHLVVDGAHHRGHLVAEPSGDDQQVRLTGGGAEHLHPEPGDVEPGGAHGHHLDRAAGQTEGHRPHRGGTGPADDVLNLAQHEVAGNLVLESHLASPLSVP